MSRIPAQIARTETINLILLNMKILSSRENKNNSFDSLIIPNRADTITIAESRTKRRGHETRKGAAPFVAEPPPPFSLEQAGCVEDSVDVRGCGACCDCEAGEETDALEHGDGAGGDGETESHCQDESGDERDDCLNDGAHVEIFSDRLFFRHP